MKVIVFDIGGTLMEYVGMPYSWVDYYKQGFEAVNKKYSLGATKADIQKSVEILKKYNPRVNYREEELSPEFLFTKATAHWEKTVDLNDCIDTFFEGFDLKAIIYPDTVPTLKKLKNMGYAVAALTDLPSSMPDELFKRDIPELLELFDLYVSSQTCCFRKPNTAGLKLISKHFGVAVSELVFVGDEEKDRKTAENAHCRFISINRNEKISGSICNLEELTVLLYR